ncbi:MAG: TonB family protein [Methylobacillus sp.]|jgi:protein TonB|nr:TonB family protein [Methylobacillus sp.]
MSSYTATASFLTAEPALETTCRVASVAVKAGESRTMPKALAIAIAVHVLAMFALVQHQPEITSPVLPLTVTLLAPEPTPVAPAPEVVPPTPVPTTPTPVVKKVETQPEKIVESVAVTQPEPQPVAVAAEPLPSAPPQAEVAQTEVAKAEPVAEAVLVQPRFDAAYLDNPAPPVPPLSRKAKEHGVVSLHVHVSATGAALEVNLNKSSGFERLDNAALETVKQWKFIPARKGDTPVDAWVFVPIQFSLKS